MSHYRTPGFVGEIPELGQVLAYIPAQVIAEQMPIPCSSPFDNGAIQMKREIKLYPTTENRAATIRVGNVAGLTTVHFETDNKQPFQVENHLGEGAPNPARGSELYVWPDKTGAELPTELTYTRHPDGYWTVAPPELVMSTDTPGYVDSALSAQVSLFGTVLALALARKFLPQPKPRKNKT